MKDFGYIALGGLGLAALAGLGFVAYKLSRGPDPVPAQAQAIRPGFPAGASPPSVAQTAQGYGDPAEASAPRKKRRNKWQEIGDQLLGGIVGGFANGARDRVQLAMSEAGSQPSGSGTPDLMSFVGRFLG